MALLASCFCCSLSVCCGVLGLYLTVAYIIALTTELWWIIEAQETLPVPAYLLATGYLTLSLFSVLLLYGLNVKKSTYLLVWMFLLGILLGPEAGMVLYMSIHHWRINTLQGLIEVTCWACRLLVNATAMLCVQSLYSTWREEKALLLRLQALKMSPVPGYHRDRLNSAKIPPRQEYLNHGYQHDEIKHVPIITNENACYPQLFIAPIDSPCEFNASSFDANVIDARNKTPDDPEKTQSLLNFPDSEEYNNSDAVKNSTNKSISLNYINYLGKEEHTQSLDRRTAKNKNSKIIRKLSPFLGRKTTDEVNVYQLNPPKVIEGLQEVHETKLDRQLKRIYSSRGMYAYDEKTRKLIYYPPEFFNHEEKFRNRLPSNESKSSVDSEDIRSKIGDVAL